MGGVTECATCVSVHAVTHCIEDDILYLSCWYCVGMSEVLLSIVMKKKKKQNFFYGMAEPSKFGATRNSGYFSFLSISHSGEVRELLFLAELKST